jgi:hypothetical protein
MANPSGTTAAVIRGLAIINSIVGGVPTNITAWANGILPQSSDATQNWEEEKIKDTRGFDAVWLARNAHLVRKFEFKPTSDTLAHAKSATVFLAPYAKLTFASSEASDLDGDYRLMDGAQIQIRNDATATYTLSCVKYSDADQNVAAHVTPT